MSIYRITEDYGVLYMSVNLDRCTSPIEFCTEEQWDGYQHDLMVDPSAQARWQSCPLQAADVVPRTSFRAAQVLEDWLESEGGAGIVSDVEEIEG